MTTKADISWVTIAPPDQILRDQFSTSLRRDLRGASSFVTRLLLKVKNQPHLSLRFKCDIQNISRFTEFTVKTSSNMVV